MNLPDAIAVLTRTPEMLDAWLRDLPEKWIQRKEGDGTWTVFDVVGHLIHGEKTDWIPSARIILQSGESRPFDPFDRTAQMRDSRGKRLPDLLDEFARLRAENLQTLHAFNLREEDFARRGRHPELGTVTLSELIAAWVAHQYRDGHSE